MIEAVVRDESRVLPVTSLLDGHFGLKDVCLSLPAVVNRRGVEECLGHPDVRPETEALGLSADAVRRWAPRSDCEPDVLDLLAANPLLTIMLVVSLGTCLVPSPSVRCGSGPRGRCLSGSASGRWIPGSVPGWAWSGRWGWRCSSTWSASRSGQRFFRGLGRRLPLMVGAAVVLGLAGLAVTALGSLLGISPAVRGGVYAGALTSTPALAVAISKAGSQEPAMGLMPCPIRSVSPWRSWPSPLC